MRKKQGKIDSIFLSRLKDDREPQTFSSLHFCPQKSQEGGRERKKFCRSSNRSSFFVVQVLSSSY